MNLKKFLMYLIFVLLLAIPFQNNIEPKNNTSQSCMYSNVQGAAIDPKEILEWLKYQDIEFNFTTSYPVGWEYQKTIDQKGSLIDGEAIVQRLSFFGPEGFIDIDVWSSQDMNLNEWLNWYEKTRNKLPEDGYDTLVAGNKAVMFFEDGSTTDTISTFFIEKDHVYRLWYTVSANIAGLEIYKKMLSEFTFTHSFVNSDDSDHFPKEMDNHVTFAIKDSALINAKISSCCEYYSFGNPFGCCSDQGNCVWWVYYKYGGVPFRGDAGTWYGQVPDYPTWQRGSQPCLYNDNIAWWPTSDYPDYGHVAFLHYYSGGSTISISEMLYCTSCGRSRSISYTNPDGYMWRLNTKE